MIQTTVEVGGMACSMCEAHINDTVRNAFPVDKVSSSHAKGKTVILSKEPLDENALRAAIEATGYHVGTIHSAPYEKKVKIIVCVMQIHYNSFISFYSYPKWTAK